VNVLEAVGAEQIKAKTLGFTDRCRTGDPNSIGELIDSRKIEQGQIQISLNGRAMSEKFKIPVADFSPTFLSITKPFELRRRGVETTLSH
jgi:hypothetical protein